MQSILPFLRNRSSKNNTVSSTMAQIPSHDEHILRSHKREREALLSKAHAAFSSYTSVSDPEEDDDFGEEHVASPSCDYSSRHTNASPFRETVRQRQARLESLRRADIAKRRASKCWKREDSIMVSYLYSHKYPWKQMLILQLQSSIVRPNCCSEASCTSWSETSNSRSTTCCDSETDTNIDTDSGSDADTDSELETDDDDNDEWDRFPSSVIPSVAVYEDEDENEDTPSTCIDSKIASHSPCRWQQLQQMHQSKVPSPLRRSSGSVCSRTGITREPSLDSIPERPEIDAL